MRGTLKINGRHNKHIFYSRGEDDSIPFAPAVVIIAFSLWPISEGPDPWNQFICVNTQAKAAHIKWPLTVMRVKRGLH